MQNGFIQNSYGIDGKELFKIRLRDKACVYCHKKFKVYPPGTMGVRSDMATIEHLNHLPPWNNYETVAYCCGSCNSSRSNFELRDWFEKLYCRERGINEISVADPVKKYLKMYYKNSK